MHLSEETPQLELKSMPGGLKYAYLGPYAVNEGWKPYFEELPGNEKKLVHLSEETPQLKLKSMPGGLKYAYLGPGKLKPRWDDPFIVREVFKHGVVVVEDHRDGRILKVNE